MRKSNLKVQFWDINAPTVRQLRQVRYGIQSQRLHRYSGTAEYRIRVRFIQGNGQRGYIPLFHALLCDNSDTCDNSDPCAEIEFNHSKIVFCRLLTEQYPGYLPRVSPYKELL